MKKLISIILFIILSCSACTGFQSRKQAKEYINNITSEDSSCESGYVILGITGHAPSCLSVEDAEELKKEGLL